MVNTNAVAVTFTATNGTIDKLLLETGVFGAEDAKFLAKYKAKLASARTNSSDDMYFMGLLSRWMSIKTGKK
jgi:hypothetical protein